MVLGFDEFFNDTFLHFELNFFKFLKLLYSFILFLKLLFNEGLIICERFNLFLLFLQLAGKSLDLVHVKFFHFFGYFFALTESTL